MITVCLHMLIMFTSAAKWKIVAGKAGGVYVVCVCVGGCGCLCGRAWVGVGVCVDGCGCVGGCLCGRVWVRGWVWVFVWTGVGAWVGVCVDGCGCVGGCGCLCGRVWVRGWVWVVWTDVGAWVGVGVCVDGCGCVGGCLCGRVWVRGWVWVFVWTGVGAWVWVFICACIYYAACVHTSGTSFTKCLYRMNYKAFVLLSDCSGFTSCTRLRRFIRCHKNMALCRILQFHKIII